MQNLKEKKTPCGGFEKANDKLHSSFLKMIPQLLIYIPFSLKINNKYILITILFPPTNQKSKCKGNYPLNSTISK